MSYYRVTSKTSGKLLHNSLGGGEFSTWDLMTSLISGQAREEPKLPELSQAWLALIGAILGGSGLKVIEHWLNRTKVKEDSATSLRAELREDLKATREELDKAEEEADEWRAKYYIMLDAWQNLRADLNQTLNEINSAGLSSKVERPQTLKEILGG